MNSGTNKKQAMVESQTVIGVKINEERYHLMTCNFDPYSHFPIQTTYINLSQEETRDGIDGIAEIYQTDISDITMVLGGMYTIEVASNLPRRANFIFEVSNEFNIYPQIVLL